MISTTVGRESDRGAALVEAALILPIFILLLFGIIDWSMFMKDKLAVTDSARVGVRTASALARVPDFSTETVKAIARAGSAMPMKNLAAGKGFVLIYRANSSGLPGSWTSMPLDALVQCQALADCDSYVWNGTSFSLTGVAQTPWPATSINACPTAADGGPPDSVGVYVQGTHDRVSRFFGAASVVSDRAVLKFEPRRRGQCK